MITAEVTEWVETDPREVHPPMGMLIESPECYHARKHGECLALLHASKERTLTTEQQKQELILECARLNREVAAQRETNNAIARVSTELRLELLECGLALAFWQEEYERWEARRAELVDQGTRLYDRAIKAECREAELIERLASYEGASVSELAFAELGGEGGGP